MHLCMIVQILVLQLLYLYLQVVLVVLRMLDIHQSYMVLKQVNNHIYFHSLRNIYTSYYYYYPPGTNYITKTLHIENIVDCFVDLEV